MSSRRRPLHHRASQSGFSLIELAIVLIVVALLGSGALFGLSSQHKQMQFQESAQQIEIALDALMGFAMSAGRLPCPADPAIPSKDGAGKEEITCLPTNCAPKSSGCECTCKYEHGVLPWQTLALAGLDPWGNRLTYFAGREFSNPVSYDDETKGIKTRFTLETVGRANIQNGSGQVVASEIPAVIVSHGQRGRGAYTDTGEKITGATGDEQLNASGTQNFISKTPTELFDDHVAWIVPTVLKSRLVSVGKLP